VSRHLPEAVRPVALFAFITGWRVSEILGLTWRQVHFGASTVRLELGTTKNGERRTFHSRRSSAALLEAQRECTAAVHAKMDRIIPRVFHRDGDPIRDLRSAPAHRQEPRDRPVPLV
jgi:integrase